MKLATKRINEIYEDLREKHGRGGGTNLMELEILAIKKYLDECADNDAMQEKM